MAYKARAPNVVNDPKAVADWAYDELKAIEQNYSNLDRIRIITSFVEPSKKRAGDIVLADGVEWDPGSGAGFYGYYGGAWHKLG